MGEEEHKAIKVFYKVKDVPATVRIVGTKMGEKKLTKKDLDPKKFPQTDLFGNHICEHKNTDICPCLVLGCTSRICKDCGYRIESFRIEI